MQDIPPKQLNNNNNKKNENDIWPIRLKKYNLFGVIIHMFICWIDFKTTQICFVLFLA